MTDGISIYYNLFIYTTLLVGRYSIIDVEFSSGVIVECTNADDYTISTHIYN